MCQKVYMRDEGGGQYSGGGRHGGGRSRGGKRNVGGSQALQHTLCRRWALSIIHRAARRFSVPSVPRSRPCASIHSQITLKNSNSFITVRYWVGNYTSRMLLSNEKNQSVSQGINPYQGRRQNSTVVVVRLVVTSSMHFSPCQGRRQGSAAFAVLTIITFAAPVISLRTVLPRESV